MKFYSKNRLIFFYIHQHSHVVLTLINMNFIVFIIYINQIQLTLLKVFKCYKE